MNKLLENKVVIVTGGGSGIGRASAILFAENGGKIIIANRREDKGNETVEMIKQMGGEAHFVKTDVLVAEQVENLVSSALSLYGRLDCAFNCGGFEGDRALITETEDENWEQILDTNLKGTYLLLKYEIRAMLMQNKGTIVNMGSISGTMGRAKRSAYNASRAAVMNLTKTSALEYIRQGIRINAVGPSATRTDIFGRMTYGFKPEIIKQYEQAHPIGRICEPVEVAEAALWLLSDKSSYVVGHTLMVDGGMSAGPY